MAKPNDRDHRNRRSWRFEALIVSGVLLTLICGLFWQGIFAGKVMSQADALLMTSPWKSVAPSFTTWHPANALLRDQCYQFIPWRLYAVDCVRRGVLPLWNPYAYCGSPFIANDQSAVFYPLTTLHYLLPFHLATLLSAIIRLYIAGIGMHYLLKRFGVRPGSALVGAIGFVFCGSNIVWLNHPHANITVLMPVLFWLTDKFITDRPRSVWAGLWAVLVGVQFLGGHLESSFNVLLPCGLFFVWRMAGLLWRTRDWKILLRPVAAGAFASLLGLMIGAIQLLPTFEYLQHSAIVRTRATDKIGPRGQADFAWRRLPGLVMPGLYGSPVRQVHVRPDNLDARYDLLNFSERNGAYVGVPMLLLAGVLLATRRRRPHTVFFVVLLLLGFCLAYRVPGVLQLFLALPGAKLVFPMLARMQLLMAFALCVLGAYGLDELLWRTDSSDPANADRRHHLGWGLLAVLLLVAVMAFVTAAVFYASDAPTFKKTTAMLDPIAARAPGLPQRAAMGFVIATGTFLATVVLCALAFLLGARLLGGRLWLIWLVLVSADLFVFAYDYNPIVEAKRVLPEVPSIRFLQREAGHHRIARLSWCFPPNVPTCFGIRDIAGFDAIDTNDLAIFSQHEPSRPAPKFRIMGVRYLLSRIPVDRAPEAPVHRPDMWIYTFDKSASRVQLPGQAEVYIGGERERVLERLTQNDFDPADSVVLWEPGSSASMRLEGEPGPAGTASFVVDDINEVVVKAKVERDGFLVLADTWFPGWEVIVDDTPAELLKANFTFRAVKLTPGEHVIRFHYRPMSFTLGLVLSLAGLTLSVVWMLVFRTSLNDPGDASTSSSETERAA